MLTQTFYQNQISRLVGHFKGRMNYSTDLVKLIWEEVKNLSENDLSRIVDDFIGGPFVPPTRDSFKKVIREKQLYQHKNEEKKAVDANSSHFVNHDITVKFFGTLLKEMNNPVFQGKVKSMKTRECNCNICHDTGLVFAKEKNSIYENFVFKCACPEGKKNINNYPELSVVYLKTYEIMETQ